MKRSLRLATAHLEQARAMLVVGEEPPADPRATLGAAAFAAAAAMALAAVVVIGPGISLDHPRVPTETVSQS
jgi:hypothetical protein